MLGSLSPTAIRMLSASAPPRWPHRGRTSISAGKAGVDGVRRPGREATLLLVKQVVLHPEPQFAQVGGKARLHMVADIVPLNAAATAGALDDPVGHGTDKPDVVPFPGKFLSDPVQIKHRGAAVPRWDRFAGREPEHPRIGLAGAEMVKGLVDAFFLAFDEAVEGIAAQADIPRRQPTAGAGVLGVADHTPHLGVPGEELQLFLHLRRADPFLVGVLLDHIPPRRCFHPDDLGRFGQSVGRFQHGGAIPQGDFPGGVGAAAVDDENLNLIRHGLAPDALQHRLDGGGSVVGRLMMETKGCIFLYPSRQACSSPAIRAAGDWAGVTGSRR